MQFFIAVSALFTVSAGYLLHQFLSGAFVSNAPAADTTSDADTAPESLRAA